MAIPTNIKTLLSGDVVEWARIEFKETWDAEASPKTMAKDNKERIHYIRKMSNTVEPSDDEEKDLFNLANRIPFDERVNHQADISDLNITLIKFFPYTQIDVVQFPEGLGGNNIIEQTFKGPIHQQLRDALQYIRNTIITEKVVKHPDRPEADRFFNYPLAAIEEALSNAVYHRAYDEREPIEVRVENDKIEIVSFPGPDRSVTLEGLKSYHVSNRRYRNRRIGDFLKELHLTEGRNTGFKKILDALEANGSPKPEFETDEARSYFISRFYIHKEFQNVLKKEPKRSRKGAKKELKKGAERKQVILELLFENPTMTQTDLIDKLGLTRKQIQTDIKDLKNEGILERKGSNRNGYWIVNKVD
ncbi:ATP-binding protein [Mediterraneibacter glycyrrhizinilyticus]|uniref:ATP-binding protein n=1 Tax=Mediterraneibacter glycyrrhizinilyticus TaxID=342942 RepID=UPI0025A36B5E|nr:ATP-binding protein [Mediterraneibacter glycyrrhizinilyticus]MDM8125980.1 ATP-binding protein [Mediterraneibacter glycyrrhizinilyticus]